MFNNQLLKAVDKKHLYEKINNVYLSVNFKHN